MFILKTTKNLQKFQNKAQSIGFVPTMGALHEGHISLVKRALSENDCVVVSIFVNPKQFNDQSDLDNYPKTIDNDILMLEKSGCDILFFPELEEIYPKNFENTEINLNGLDLILEGAKRPGHFKGVAQVVLKLFEIVKPQKAYFGQKDFQQTVVIKQLIKEKALDINMVVCPILREKSGLAMSSRNIRLPEDKRLNAGFVFEILNQAKLDSKHYNCQTVIAKCTSKFNLIEGSVIDYLEIVNQSTLEALNPNEMINNAAILVVIIYGGVRLLDNILID